MRYAITANRLSVRFAETYVLHEISFQVRTGTVFGLLSPSGAGKTTLIKLLTGQLYQDRGEAELLGRDTRKLTAAEHRQTGAMMDNYGLYERLSVYDNLAFFADIYSLPLSTVTDTLNYHRLKPVGCCGLKATYCD